MNDNLIINFEYSCGSPTLKMRWMVPYSLTVELIATPEMRYLLSQLEKRVKTQLMVDLELGEDIFPDNISFMTKENREGFD